MTETRCRECTAWFDKKLRECPACGTDRLPVIHQAPGWKDNLAKQVVSAERLKRL